MIEFMAAQSKRVGREDINQIAVRIVREATGEAEAEDGQPREDPATLPQLP